MNTVNKIIYLILYTTIGTALFTSCVTGDFAMALWISLTYLWMNESFIWEERYEKTT